MNNLHNLSLGRKLAMAICVLLVCLSFAAGIFIPRFINSAAESDTAQTTAESAGAIDDETYYGYTSINAKLYDADVVIYSGFTTADGFKQNLIVNGTYTPATGTQQTRALFPSEYSIIIDGAVKSGKLFENLSEQTTVSFRITSNGQFSDPITVTVIPDDDLPKFTGKTISVNDLRGVAADHDNNSVKSLLTVTAGTDKIVNRELYTVNMGTLTAGSNSSFTVTTHDNVSSSAVNIYDIQYPEINSVSLTVKDEYSLRNGAYGKNVGGVWYSAFVAGATRSQVFANLDVVVFYENSVRTLVMPENLTGDSATVSTGETLVFTGVPSAFNEGENVISLTVRSQKNETKTTALTLTFEAKKVVEIELDIDRIVSNLGGEENIYSYTTLGANALNGSIYPIYNDGTKSTTAATANASVSFSFSGSLTPTANDMGKETYTKEVTVNYTESNITVSKPISLTVHYYAEEISVESKIAGTTVSGNTIYPVQTMLQPFNFDGLYATIEYTYPNPDNPKRPSTSTLLAPLSEFKDSSHILIELYNDNEELISSSADNDNKTPIVTDDFDFAVIKFRYDTTKDEYPALFNYDRYGIYSGISVSGGQMQLVKYSVDVPDIDTQSNNSYNENLYKEIIITDEILANYPDMVDVSLFADKDCANTSGQTELTVNGQQIAKYEDGKVKFYAGGVPVFIRLQLKSGDITVVGLGDKSVNSLANLQWGNITGTTAEKLNDNTLVYEVIISKASLDIVIDYGSDSNKSWVYGSPSIVTVKGVTITGIVHNLDVISVDYTLEYYKVTGEKVVNIGADMLNPKLDVGTYFVVAVSEENKAYEAGTSPKTILDGAPQITVTPKQLDATKLKSFSYDRNVRHVSDFIDSNSFGIQYGEKVEDIMSASNSAGNVALTTKTYKNVSDSETLTLTLTSNNYYWKNSSNDITVKNQSVKIEITALILDITIDDGDYLDFIYGGEKPAGTSMSDLPAVTKTLTAKDKDNTDLGDGRFYAKVNFEYRLADGTLLDAKDFRDWNYNDTDGYVVYVKTAIDTANGDRSGDYNTPSHYAYFTVSRAQIKKVTFGQNGGSDEYDSNNKTLTLTDWQSGKMTASVASDKNAPDASADTNGIITVKHAGVYTITVTLNNNYDWDVADATDNTNYHYPVSFTYTVTAKEIEFVIGINEDSYDYDGGTHSPTPTLSGTSATELTIKTIKLYDKDKIEISSAPSAIGDYFIAVTEWTVNAGYDAYVVNDYIISYKPFSIITTAMAKPTLKENGGTLSESNTKVTVTYNGSEYKFEDFINGYTADYVYGTNSKIVITIAAVTSGRRAMTDVNTYNVVVKPATNFKWDTEGNDNDISEVNFAFVIVAKQLTGLNWGNEASRTFTYDGTSHVPAATPEGLFTGDTVTVSVSGGRTDAGNNYEATADMLTGAQGFNYTLPSIGITTTFTINKRSINVPSYTATTLTFGVNTFLAFTLNEGFTDVTGWSWSGVVSATITSTVTTDGTSFDFANKKFNFVNAGTYTITFNIKPEHANNYEWNGNNTVSGIEVSKLKINAPTISGDASNLTFGTNTTLAFNTSKVTGFNADWTDVVSYTVSGVYNFDGVTKAHKATDGIAEGTSFNFANGTFNFLNAGDYTITFNIKPEHENNYEWNGDHKSEVTVNRKTIVAPKLVDPADNTKTGRTLERNDDDRKPAYIWNSESYPNPGDIFTVTYGGFTKGTNDSYAAASEFKNVGEYYICFTITNENYLNYVFAENTGDTENISGFVTQYGKKEYTETAVRIYLNYAVTRKLLDIKYNVTGYIYGNGDNLDISTVMELIGDNYPLTGVGFIQTITFSLDGTPIGSVRINGESISYGEGTDTSLFKNYLPWNAGEYAVETLIEFDDTQLNELSGEYTLTVAKRVISVTWSGAEEVEYNGRAQMLTAVINNAPDGESSLPTLVVSSARNAGTHELEVTEIDYTGFTYQNYVLPETAITHAFKINKRAITVDITNGGTSEYGYALNTNTITWDYATDSKKFADDSHKTYVIYELQKNGSTVTKYNADTYNIVAKLTPAGAENYELVCATKGSYTVTPRAITISLDTTKTSKTYGKAVDLDSPAVYMVSYTGTDTNWLASGDTRESVFTVTSYASAASATVGTYDITLDIKSNPNYTVSHTAADWKNAFTVSAAEITVGGVTGSSWTYDAQDHALLNAVTVSGVVLQGGMSATYYYSNDNKATWKPAAGATLKNVADSGTYYIKITATNHADKILEGVQVTISKAQLTVGLNFEIFYSEDSPVTRSFLMNASDLSDSRYTVTGFAGAEGAKETLSEVNASGTLTYTTDYSNGKTAGNYSLVLTVSSLSSANYSFIAGTSKLTVKALNVSVEAENITATYWSLIDQTSPVYGKIKFSTNNKNTYDSSKTVDITGISAKDILTYTTTAIKVDDSDVVTDMAGTGTYTVTVKSKDIAGKYILNTTAKDNEAEVALPDFRFVINNATLQLNSDVNGYTGNYDEAYHTLTVGGNGKFAEAYNPDKNALTVKYYVAKNETSDINWNGADVVTELPEFINVGTYYLYYNLSAKNHDSHTAHVVIEINFVETNTVTQHFEFEGKNTVFEEESDIGEVIAWIYGLAGYNGKGNIVEPVATFDGVPNGGSGTAKQFVFTLYYNGNIVSVEGTFHTAADLFEAVLNNGLFNAGSYRIHYEMEGNDNFGKAEGDRYFKVGQKSLTITANNFEVTYGEDVAGYEYTVDGLVNNGKKTDTINDVFVGGKLPAFTSTYQKGNFVDTYTIHLDKDGYTSTNYDFEFVDGTLTVVQREITIVIENKQSSFHYYNDGGEEAKALTYSFYDANGTKFYAGDINGNNQLDTKVFTLYTNATIKQNGFNTQNVGAYPIFAVFNAIEGDAENRTYAHNYIITIVEKGVNTLYDKEVTEEILGAVDGSLSVGNLIENAGIYTITPAQLQLNPDENPSWATTQTGQLTAYTDPMKSRMYDGYYKGFTAKVTDNGVGMEGVTFYAVYGTEQKLETMHPEMYKDVGTYYYRFITDNPNYEWNQGGFNTLTISAQPINVTVTIDGVEDANKVVEKTYKANAENKYYKLIFTFNGLQQSEIIDLVATVTPDFASGSDAYFNSYKDAIYGTFATTNDEGVNTYTISVKNAGVYDIVFSLANTTEMKNYSFDYSYKFTVNRADFIVRANSSVVQYGTVIDKNGTPQLITGVTAPSYAGVTSENHDNVADYYRFYGFSLVQNVHDKVAAEGKINGTEVAYFYIGDVTYGFNGTAYAAATTQANTVLNIQPDASSIHAFNYNIGTTVNNTEYGKLYVAQRRINVTVNGYNASNPSGTSFASTIYSGAEQQPTYSTNALKFFTPETDWYGAATDDETKLLESIAAKLTVSNAINAGDYTMHAFQDDHTVGTTVTNNTNYKVTFINDNQALFRIAKKDIRLQVVSTKDGKPSFDIIYGDSTEGYYKVIYYGMVSADGGHSTSNYTNDTQPIEAYNLTNGSSAGSIIFKENYTLNGTTASGGIYAPWTRHAGQKFLIDISDSDLSFDNYNIVAKDFAVMTVVARKVTATTSDRVYTEDTDLHGGKYGIEHDAQIVFTDVKDGSISYADSEYKPNQYLSYLYVGTENGGSAYNSSTAPTKAGTYTVQITFSEGANYRDYVFDESQGGKNVSSTSVTFDYNVNKKAITLDWDSIKNLIYNEGEDKWVKITSPYVQALTVVNFVQLIKDDNSVENIERATGSGDPEDGQYAINGEGFSVKIYSVGRYSLRFVFNSDAVNNYKWDDEDKMKDLSLAFSVYTEGFEITNLDMKSWTYNDVDENGEPAEHIPTYVLTNGVVEPLSFSYATVTGSLPENVSVNSEIDEDTYKKIGKSTPSTNIPVNAGTYILVANYTGTKYSSTSAYFIFEIYQREVQTPVFVQADKTYAYNGEEQTAEIKYNPGEITGAYTGNSSLGTDGIILSATDAGTYKVTFTLNDVRNYKWAEDAKTQITWTINKATDNEVSVQKVETSYGDSYEVSAVSKYVGVITYSYAVRGDGETQPSANAQWKEVKPVNAGNYWIKAECAGTDNFEKASGVNELTISKAVLTATPEGYMTYGDGFVNAVKNILYTGWKVQELTVTENVEYTVEGYDGTGVLTVKDGGYVLVASGELTVSEGTDETYGFPVANYDIQIVKGKFTVNKKDIEVTIENLSSIYGEEFDPAEVKLTEASLGGLVGEDRQNAFEALSITPTVLGNMTDGYYNAFAYVLSSVGHENSKNYNVTVRSGIYRVDSLDVYVTVDAGGGEYGSVVPATKTGVYTADGDNDVESIFGELNVEFRYSGTANNGQAVNNSVRVPTLAGSYTAVARLTNSNFNLVTDKGTPSSAFIISRKTITESDITVEELKYNGQEQSPVIVDKKYSELYTAEQVAFVNVSDYTVKLTLKDADNYRWSSVDGNDYNLPFSIGRGDNEFTTEVVITGWSFGGSANLPQAETAFGDSSTYIYTYSSSEDGEYTRTVPTQAGTYWVKVTVPQSDNYNEKTSEPVSFTIAKRAVKAPVLEVVAEGENANTVYTGARLKSAVKDYDPVLMRIIYEGDLSSTGSVAVYALNAGEYKVYVALNDESNYMWAEGTTLSDNNAQLTWTVARKKIAKPTMPSEMYMVNGGTLTFTPVGYDESTMTIKGNTTSYGGVFKVTVSIKDSVNFEWADGSTEDITFDWVVVGWDTVFIIVVSVLGVIAGISAIAIGIQYGLHKRRKKAEAVKSAAAEKAFHENVAKMAESKEAPEKPTEDNSLDEPAEQNGEANSEEAKPEEEVKDEDKETTDEGGNNNE